MATPPVTFRARVRGGFFPGSSSAFPRPSVNAGTIALGARSAGLPYLPYPAAQGELTWQGGKFGLTAPTSGGLTANVWQIVIRVGHFVSDPGAFTGVTAQVWDANSSSVIATQALTLSSSLITETITTRNAYTASHVPDLSLRLTWHQTGVGYASVQHAAAEVSYSYSDSAGMITVAGFAATGTPAISVAPLPPVSLISAGAVAASLSPSFGRPTTAGDLLIAWVFTNSGSGTFSTTCSNPSWTLAGSAGAAFGWESLWYKINCGGNETAPTFSDSGTSQPLSELLEFSPVTALDRVGSGHGTPNATYTAAGPDTVSGDLIFGFATWNGSNTGPAVIGLSGTDSSGAVLSLSTADNHASTGTQFWVTGWGQASAPAGPGADTMSATLGFFAGGGGLMASFRPAGAFTPNTAPPVPPRTPMGSRAIALPARIGGRAA